MERCYYKIGQQEFYDKPDIKPHSVLVIQPKDKFKMLMKTRGEENKSFEKGKY